MKLSSFEAIVRSLNGAGVRYLVAGGLAANAHGYLRFTKDVDFVVESIPDNTERAFSAPGTLGYRSLVPITAEQFANAPLRESWIRDKGTQVLQFWSDDHRETPIDVFVTEPFPFDDEYQRALVKPLHGSAPVTLVSDDNEGEVARYLAALRAADANDGRPLCEVWRRCFETSVD